MKKQKSDVRRIVLRKDIFRLMTLLSMESYISCWGQNKTNDGYNSSQETLKTSGYFALNSIF